MNIFLYILSGLSLFLFSLDQIKFNLNNIFASKIQKLISKSVNTTFKSFFIGFLSAAIIQSSSGTTAIAISLLSSKYIKPKDCLGIIIGANLGTCITTFIFAININNISLYIVFISFIIYLILSKYRKYIILTIYIGIMLLGLDILNYGFNLLINNNFVYTIIQTIQNSNILSILFGILSTAIIQSSSGIIGIVEGMYNVHLINLNSSICIMLGANIGTTLTGYLATINTKNITGDNFVNTGALYFEGDQSKTCYIGGVVGHGGGAGVIFTNMINTGNITVTKAPASTYVGGIKGYSVTSLDGSKVYCDIFAKDCTYVGIVTGRPRVVEETVVNYATNCQVGGKIATTESFKKTWDDDTEDYIEGVSPDWVELDGTNYFSYIYGGATDWSGVTPAYDGCSWLSEKPTVSAQ